LSINVNLLYNLYSMLYTTYCTTTSNPQQVEISGVWQRIKDVVLVDEAVAYKPSQEGAVVADGVP